MIIVTLALTLIAVRGKLLRDTSEAAFILNESLTMDEFPTLFSVLE